MDLMRYINALREFKKREGYYPTFGKPDEQRDPQGNEKPTQPTRRRPLPCSKLRPWK